MSDTKFRPMVEGSMFAALADDVHFSNKGAVTSSPYIELDRDDQTAPGFETLFFASSHARTLLTVHRYSGDWPVSVVTITVSTRGGVEKIEHQFSAGDDSWFVVGWLAEDQTFVRATDDDRLRVTPGE